MVDMPNIVISSKIIRAVIITAPRWRLQSIFMAACS